MKPRRIRTLRRLAKLGILVGVVLSTLGIDPLNLWRSLQNLVLGLWDMGFDAIWWLWRYFLIGAVLVIPIWVLIRLTRSTSGRA